MSEKAKSMISLRQYIHEAIEDYFVKLDGCKPANLYNLVIKEIEIPLFKVVMKKVGGNQSKAASVLGLSRGTLRKKLKEYGLEKAEL